MLTVVYDSWRIPGYDALYPKEQDVADDRVGSGALGIDRGSLTVSGGRRRDRVALGLLDAYGALSRPVMQRGLYKACRTVGATLWRDRTATVRLGSDAVLSFPASDPYWNRMLLRSYDHEPEMAHLLRRLATTDYGFVDCGANIGYWSVFVASRSCGGGKPVLAVEASAATFALLQANATAFPDKIAVFHRAILDRSGISLHLNSAAHEARGIAASGEDTAEAVLSLSIDDLVAENGWSDRPLVVKLDVEGVEHEALRGMARCLAADAMVIYEDHGADASHALTRHMLGERGLSVFLLLDELTLPILAAEELDRHKRDHTKGYNLVALMPDSRWSAIVAG